METAKEQIDPRPMAEFKMAKMEPLDEDDDWINDVDISRFSSEVFPDLRTFKHQKPNQNTGSSHYPKPAWSYSCLIGLALKNSDSGELSVSEIYAFMCEHFPYFRTAPPGWKNSVRHNLSLNKCFGKIEVESDSQGRKCCLWRIREDKMEKMEMDIKKWKERDQGAIFEGMARPQDLQAIEDGTHGMGMISQSSELKPIKMEQLESIELQVKQEPVDDSLQSQRPKLPAILNRHTVKRPIPPFTRHASPAKTSALVKVAPPRPRTPSKRPRLDLLSASPLHSLTHINDYDAASSALTDNSLMSLSLCQSPYKGPTTFPSTLSL